MGKFEKIIIASDLDGTFLGENGSYVERNLEAIEKFKKEGGHFTIASGRDSFFLLKPYPELAQICNAPMIACNGAYIYDLKTSSEKCTVGISPTEVIGAVRMVEKHFPGVFFRLSQRKNYVYESDRRMIPGDRELYGEFCRFLPFGDILAEEWLKMVFCGIPEDISAVHSLLNSLYMPTSHVVSATPNIVEIIPRAGSKASKLPALKSCIAEQFGQRPDEYEIAAIGDYYNDFEMISAADIPATVENAPQELKNIKNVYVACHHRDGAIADLIAYLDARQS